MRRARWKLEDLIDFEVALGAWDGVSRPNLLVDGGDRRTLLHEWLEQTEGPRPGRRWTAALGWAGTLLGIVTFCGGVGAAWAALDRGREGVHVVLFLATTLFVPWLILLVGLLAWLFRPAGSGLLASALWRWAGKRAGAVVDRFQENPELTKALGWRAAGKVQGAAANFHFGAVAGLLAMVFFRKVGFFWETTTETAMERILAGTVKVLSQPWGAFAPSLLPDISGTRRGDAWHGGGESWWVFLILALAFWGVLPRLLLQGFAQWNEWRVLRKATFQSPRQRKLWRVLTGVKRGAEPQGPTDGALVIDLGGVSPERSALRPFFLNRLRMNPVAWEALGVLNPGSEASARAALERSPAGVVVLAEGWSLAPRQVEETLRRVLAKIGGRRLVVYVANFNAQGAPVEPTAAERQSWEAFVDGLRDVELECVIHEEPSGT